MLYQLSYEATHWERGQFIEFISSHAVISYLFHIKTSYKYSVELAYSVIFDGQKRPESDDGLVDIHYSDICR